jgi:signal transduction histidine kinase
VEAIRPHESETLVTIEAQGRINRKVGVLLVGGMSLLFLVGLLPRSFWPCIALGALGLVINERFFVTLRRGKPDRVAAKLMWIVPIIAFTVAIHLLGELGSRVGMLMYFLLLITGHNRRVSGFTPFQLANGALLAFAALRLAEYAGWLAPVTYWQDAAHSAALQITTVLCLGLVLNCAALMAQETERTLAARAAALVTLNRTLTERNAQLHRLQQEFESYASGVAHDLANPLAAAMEGFVALEQLSPHADGETRELASLTKRNMARALEMLDGLRAITKTVTAAEEVAEVRMEDVLGEVIAEFDLRLRKTGIRLIVPEDLPVIALQRVKMVQVCGSIAVSTAQVGVNAT